jgi:hypothetical protein
MTIIVKKPFEPEPFDVKNKGIKNVNDTTVVHLEFEEKPVVDSITQMSEDVHGGSEVTFSLPDSQNNSPTPNPNSPNEQESQNTANGNQGSADVNNTDTVNNNNDNQGAQGRQNQEQENQEPNNMQNQGNEQNSENDDTEKGNEGEKQSGTYNTQQVVDVNAVSASSKYYQTEFYRLIEMISEEKTRTFDPMGSEEYNVKKLLFKQFERKPLSSYKMNRVRESVVIILDNSGSMQWWAGNLAILADLAMQRNDVEVYLAPNGHIEEMIYPRSQLVNHDDVVRGLRNRRIIYVGDFDGADTPIELSWFNDVIWICPEERYLNFLDHDWVHYDESRFRGAFLRVFTLGEMFNAFRRLLSNPSLKLWYDLCNESHKCGGEGA